MNTLTKRILTIGSAAAIILLLVWFVINRIMISRFALVYPMMSRHSPYSVNPSSTLMFFGILGVALVLLLVVSLLQPTQTKTDREASAAETPCLTDDPCPGCGADVMSNWNICPYCGYDLK